MGFWRFKSTGCNVKNAEARVKHIWDQSDITIVLNTRETGDIYSNYYIYLNQQSGNLLNLGSVSGILNNHQMEYINQPQKIECFQYKDRK